MKGRRSKHYYPLMLDVADKHCVIIGGGAVAQRKAESLIHAGAKVILISPSYTAQVEQWARSGAVSLVRETYREGMPQLRQAVLVFAATDQAEINAAVRLEAEALGKLVTVADDSARSGFIVPAVVRRGKLVIAVSTGGSSPAVAGKLRDRLERMFGDEYEVYLDLLQELRTRVKELVGSTAERQELFKLMLDWELLTWIRSGRFEAGARQELIRRVEADPTADGMAKLNRWIQSFIE